MNLAKTISAVILGLLLVLLAACNPLSETKDRQYRDYDSLAEAGEIERGWAPDFTPRSATNIHLKYELDTNSILLAFDFDAADTKNLTKTCHPADQAPAPLLAADWWPKNLQDASLYECPEGYLAVQDSQGLFWSGTRPPQNAIPIRELEDHPKKYLDLDGKRVTVVGYVDFDNIHDLRETTYRQEAIGFVRKRG